ncbi:multi-component regulatory system-4 [Streptomyces viridochromogenes]|nr:DUF742 domain-containing protein [Streptomyces viridochromogenes]KOG08446.1 multi-component regulatory system-4 [Streptomyces viridochromogenes]KOG09057.1 multi-component regulatory system-4 [Streptomyces viridochromogenes]
MADGTPTPDPDGAEPDGSDADGSDAEGSGAEGRPEPVGPASAVRPFLVTAGRVAADADGRSMPVETQVVATTEGIDSLERLAFEQHDIVAVCRLPQSLAEIAARLRLHLNVVRVLAEDLRAAGQLTVHVPDSDVVHDASVLRRVIAGLRAIPDSRGVTP